MIKMKNSLGFHSFISIDQTSLKSKCWSHRTIWGPGCPARPGH